MSLVLLAPAQGHTRTGPHPYSTDLTVIRDSAGAYHVVEGRDYEAGPSETVIGWCMVSLSYSDEGILAETRREYRSDVYWVPMTRVPAVGNSRADFDALLAEADAWLARRAALLSLRPLRSLSASDVSYRNPNATPFDFGSEWTTRSASVYATRALPMGYVKNTLFMSMLLWGVLILRDMWKRKIWLRPAEEFECASCGYDRRGLGDDAPCPECGT